MIDSLLRRTTPSRGIRRHVCGWILLLLSLLVQQHHSVQSASAAASVTHNGIVGTLRQQGMQFYQEQSYPEAAQAFGEAAATEASDPEEYATLRLHQALSLLQAAQYDAVIDTATELLLQEAEPYSTAIRARAYFRRSQAYQRCGQSDAALRDARTAAFLGDRKAVAFYGQCLRSTHSEEEETSSSIHQSSSSSSSSSSSRSFLSPPPPSDIPLAQSVLQSLWKRLDDPATQDTICHVLQQQPILPPPLRHWCTPPRLRLAVRLGRGIQGSLRLLRVGGKYRTVATMCLLGAWLRAAVQQPLPLRKRSRA